MAVSDVYFVGASNASIVSGGEWDLNEFKKEERRILREWRPKCQQVWSKRAKLNEIFDDKRFTKQTLSKIAQYLSDGRYGCRKSPELALTILKELVGPNPIAEPEISILELMVQLHGQVKGPGFEDRVTELRRVLWIKRGYYGADDLLQWDPGTMRSFIAREDIWTFMTAEKTSSWKTDYLVLDAYFDPLSSRFDPARAIEIAENKGNSDFKLKAADLLIDGTYIPKDADRAEKLLWELTKSYPGEARKKLLFLLSPKLDGPNPEVATAAADALFNIAVESPRALESDSAIRERLVTFYAHRLVDRNNAKVINAAERLGRLAGAGTETAMQALGPWVEGALRADNADEKLAAWRIISTLAQDGISAAKALLDRDIERTGGVVEVGFLDGVKFPKRSIIMSEDYPSRSISREEEGVVAIELLMPPGSRDRVIAFVTKGATPILNRVAMTTGLRRLRQGLAPNHAGRYVRIKLPDIHFRLTESCGGPEVYPQAEPDAVIVNAKCNKPDVQN